MKKRVELKVSIPASEKENVSAVLSVPAGYLSGKGTGVIIAHGAGNDMTHPLMEAFAQGVADAGYLALRFNFPYREKGRKVPDGPEVLSSTWEAAYRFLQNHPAYHPKDIVGAGKSLGGRIASLLVAAGRLPVSRLIFLGYPLHPAGQKEKIRDRQLYEIKVPMLFFAGTRDPLCDLDLLRPVVSRLRVPWKLEVIEGGDHSFHVPKSLGVTDEEIYGRIVTKARNWMGETSKPKS